MAKIDRRGFEKALLAAVAGAYAFTACRRPPATIQGANRERDQEKAQTMSKNETASHKRMPVLFVGHGSPMNAIEDNAWSRGFQAMGALLPAPKVILSVSAHWFVRGSFVTGNDRPKTIHDFGGFPDELFQMQYPAPGDVALAGRVVDLLGKDRAASRSDWGLDHGTWSVLHHLRPAADIPVVQLSIDATMPPAGHLDLARALRPLRDEGVLIMGSGNVTHNLRYAMTSYSRGDVSTPTWASQFDSAVEQAAQQHDGLSLAKAVENEAGRMSHPTLDHFLPLLYAMGAADTDDQVSFPVSGFDLGSLSMRSVLFG
jgi:4,5-DOPA dioxygenase extradiol